MGVVPGPHVVNGWVYPLNAHSQGGLPLIRSTSSSWSAESCSEHPDAARSALDLFIPRNVWRHLGPDVGQPESLYVGAQGLDGNGGVVAQKSVAYFEGRTDGIEREERDGKAFTAIPSSIGTPRGYGTAPLPDGVTVELPSGGSTIRVENNSDTSANITVPITFTVPPGSAAEDAWHTGQYFGNSVRLAGMSRMVVESKTWSSATEVRIGSDRANSGEWMNAKPAGGQVTAVLHLWYVPAYIDLEVLVTATELHRGRPAGYDVMLTGSDYLAVLGRHMIGARPWAFNVAAGRIALDLNPEIAQSRVHVDWVPFRDGTGQEPGGESMVMNAYVRPLDVDNRSALDVARQTMAACGRVAVGLAGRVGWSLALKSTNGVAVGTRDYAYLYPQRDSVSEIPSDAVPNVPEHISIDKVATRVTASWWVPTETATDVNDTGTLEERFYTVDHPSIVRYGVIERKIDTHQFTTRRDYDLPYIAPQLTDRMNQMLNAQALPRWYFGDSVKIVPRDLDAVRGLAELIDNSTRYGWPFRLLGDLPSNMDPEHRVKGGKFGWDGERWRVELDTEPIDYSGTDTATFATAESRPDLTLWSMRGITLDEMRNVQL